MDSVTTPQTITLSGINLDAESGFQSFDDGARKYLLADRPDDAYWYAALWNGHEFECPRVTAKFNNGRFWFEGHRRIPGHTEESYMLLHFPIDPRIIYQDVAGATRAYPNETNTGWLFAHCDQDYHRDFEKHLASDTRDVFGREVEDATEKLAEATNSTTIEIVGARLDAWKDFREEVVGKVVAVHRSRPLGYYQQNPHDSHTDQIIRDAIAKVKAEWKATAAVPGNTDARDRYAAVRGDVDSLMPTPHTYETRWDQAARLEAERKAAEGESGGGDGTEGPGG